MKVVFACGRFNPPTIGHLKMVEEMKALAEAKGAQLRLFTTRSHDRKKNPLSPEEKLGFLHAALPSVPVTLAKTPFEAAEQLAEEGFEEATLVVGEDRFALAENVARYSEEHGLKTVFHLVGRPDDAPSATQARTAAQSGDFEQFQRLVPAMDEVLVRDLYRAVRLGMGEEWPT